MFTILDKDGDGMFGEPIGHLTKGIDAGEVSTWFEMDLDADKDGLLGLRAAQRVPEEHLSCVQHRAWVINLTARSHRRFAWMQPTLSPRPTRVAKVSTAGQQSSRRSWPSVFKAKTRSRMLAQLDLDGNGSLSRDEIAEVFLKYSALRLALRDA